MVDHPSFVWPENYEDALQVLVENSPREHRVNFAIIPHPNGDLEFRATVCEHMQDLIVRNSMDSACPKMQAQQLIPYLFVQLISDMLPGLYAQQHGPPCGDGETICPPS